MQRRNPAPTHDLLEHFGDVLKHCGDARETAVAVIHVLQVTVNSGSVKARSRKAFIWALRKNGVSQRLFTALQVIVKKLSIIREDERIYELVKKEHFENDKRLTLPGKRRGKKEEENAFCVVAEKLKISKEKVFKSYHRSRQRDVRRMAGYGKL
jgi:hypothetical protein